MALPLLEIEKELAKKRKGFRTDLHDIPPNLGERGEATEIVAKKIGVARGLLEQALWLRENVPEEELEQRRGQDKDLHPLFLLFL